MADLIRKMNENHTAADIDRVIDGFDDMLNIRSVGTGLKFDSETGELSAEDGSSDALTELIDGGPKNILKFTNYQTNGMGSLTHVVNSDGTLTFTGSTGSNAGTMWCDCTFSEAKPLVISGSLNSSGITFRLRTTSNADVAVDSGSGAVFTPTVGTTYRAFIRFDASKTYDNVTVKPMICAKTYWDISQAYAPYRPSYQELYDMVLALQSGTRSLSVEPSEEEMR